MSIVGDLGSALQSVISPDGPPVGNVASEATNALASVGLNAIGSWVLGGTESALKTVAHVIGTETAPNLESTWFGSAYWRVAALAALLTVPFLFAAAIQALVRSDLALLTRSAFLYMPLSLIAVGLAAPVTMLLLAATDQMSAAVSAVGVEGGATFLDSAARAAASYAAASASPFFVVVIAMFALMAALALALEMLIREAAVYVVVLMLPLGFAAMVWPARRIWATRLIELLVSLILSKFVIVAVLSLAGSAFASGTSSGISQLLVAMALVMLSVWAPWTLMRILPFTELAAGAAGALRRDLPSPKEQYNEAAGHAHDLVDPARAMTARLTGRGSTGGGDEDGPLAGFTDGSPTSGPGGGAGGASMSSGSIGSGSIDGSAGASGRSLDDAGTVSGGLIALGPAGAGATPEAAGGGAHGAEPNTGDEPTAGSEPSEVSSGTTAARLAGAPAAAADLGGAAAADLAGAPPAAATDGGNQQPMHPALASAGSWDHLKVDSDLAQNGPKFPQQGAEPPENPSAVPSRGSDGEEAPL